MEIGPSDKVAVLLSRLEFHAGEIRRREEKETRLFEWCSALLLAAFGAAIGLSGVSTQPSSALFVKLVSSLLVIAPTAVFCLRILSQRRSMARQAAVVERLQDALRLFEPGFYTAASPLYPGEWSGRLMARMSSRTTPVSYVLVLTLMTVCVVATLWRVF